MKRIVRKLHSLPAITVVLATLVYIFSISDGSTRLDDFVRVVTGSLSLVSAVYCLSFMKETWTLSTTRLMWLAFATLFIGDTGLIWGNIGEPFEWYGTPAALVGAVIFFFYALEMEKLKNEKYKS